MQETENKKIAKNKTDRSVLMGIFGTMVNGLHGIAPKKTTKLLRKYGFYVPRYRVGEKNSQLLKKAHCYQISMREEKIQVYDWQPANVESPKTVLLVHGWGTSGLQLSSFVEPLLSHGFRVVAFDQKGHGLSSSISSSYIEFLTGTEILVKHLQPSLVAIVGHSMGASTALKISELVTDQVRVVALAPMPEIKQVLTNISLKFGISDKVMGSIVQEIEAESHWSLEKASGFDFKSLARHQVLLVHDQQDTTNPIQRSQQIQSQIHGSEILITNDLGHNRILRSESVIQKVVKFLT
jgi:pimeloyl-ACP methyl ester carboxylesterase